MIEDLSSGSVSGGGLENNIANRAGAPFPIVGTGAAAEGLSVLEQFLTHTAEASLQALREKVESLGLKNGLS